MIQNIRQMITLGMFHRVSLQKNNDSKPEVMTYCDITLKQIGSKPIYFPQMCLGDLKTGYSIFFKLLQEVKIS